MAVVLPACGDPKDASLCTAFDEFVDARAAVRAIDPDSLNAEQAKDIAENYLASVNRLQQTADDRYEQQLFDLEAAVNDVLLTLASVQDDADIATWGPLVEDDIETAADAAAQVESSIEPSCNPDTSD
jgi:hypothetical protein